MRLWSLGFLLVFSTLAYPKEKEVEFFSRVISYTLCSKCEACSGVMLDGKNILTAAHCLEERYRQKNGKYILKIYQERTRGIYSLSTYRYRFRPHPKYDEKNHFNDLMIINFKVGQEVLFRGSPLGEIARDGKEDLRRDKLADKTFLAEGFGGQRGEEIGSPEIF